MFTNIPTLGAIAKSAAYLHDDPQSYIFRPNLDNLCIFLRNLGAESLVIRYSFA
ncbi:hypothetical protein [Nostoc sp. UHCC 0870]|uniref:hypothetical protein n=1 Tax=Nostoc sp. UHCC 0870 TaxID=2914041 RepID=UPI001EDEC82D|nr:hypothetical protein [Nostoc sp. UHCC 0870]UKO98415.1 hypothetical protein L6494_01320 [Nostoc sp. UHCC 0870]